PRPPTGRGRRPEPPEPPEPERPKRAPERPLRDRKASTVVAWPERIAPTAWLIMPPGAAPPGPDEPQYVSSRRPSAWARSLWATPSMSQRTMPSTSDGRSPASATAASDASTASDSVLRPELEEKRVVPMPLM